MWSSSTSSEFQKFEVNHETLYIPKHNYKADMSQAKSFRELIGVPPSTASPVDSSLIIIDAQNEYAEGQLKTANIDSTRKAIADLLNVYRKAGSSNIIHVTHKTPEGAPVFTQGTALAQEFDELKAEKGEYAISKGRQTLPPKTDLL